MSQKFVIVDNQEEIFYPNVCYVCKKKADNENTVICKCKMIRYCSDIHRKQHVSEHADICKIFQEMIAHKELQIYPNYISRNEWFEIKNTHLIQVSYRLQRKVSRYEMDMILFPRSCLYCHTRDKLLECSHCLVVNYCIKHREQYLVIHQDQCSEFKVCFALDNFKPTKLEDTGIKINYLPELTNNTEINMFTFLDNYVIPKIPPNSDFPDRQLYLQSEFLTRPLTLLFGLSKLNIHLNMQLTEYTMLKLYVVANDLWHMNIESSWEILLHIMPNLKTLNITIFYLSPIEVQRDIFIQLCENCIENSKSIQIVYYQLSCNQFPTAKQETNCLSVIVMFTAGMFIQDSTTYFLDNECKKKNLPVLAQYKCPLILSSLSEKHAELERDIISNELTPPPQIIFKGKNPCKSIRPYRDYESEVVYYDNCVITVYDDLTHQGISTF